MCLTISDPVALILWRSSRNVLPDASLTERCVFDVVYGRASRNTQSDMLAACLLAQDQEQAILACNW